MDAGQSDIRNAILAPVFKKLGIIEQWGNGLKLISGELNDYPEIELKWTEPGIAFRVSFIKKNFTAQQESEKSSQKSSQKIIEIIKNNSQITTTEISGMLGITRRAVAKNIAKLQEEGIIKRIGPDKGGHWEIIE